MGQKESETSSSSDNESDYSLEDSFDEDVAVQHGAEVIRRENVTVFDRDNHRRSPNKKAISQEQLKCGMNAKSSISPTFRVIGKGLKFSKGPTGRKSTHMIKDKDGENTLVRQITVDAESV
jgi:hypothetical protein